MSSAPERIHGWQNTQLSVARHYGGCRYNGHEYIIAYKEAGQPLVRVDVVKREAKRASCSQTAKKSTHEVGRVDETGKSEHVGGAA